MEKKVNFANWKGETAYTTRVDPAKKKSAAAALSKMARKKGAEALQLQVEVENEVQWKTLLKREGLIVVDVYASWAGPSSSMVSILKKTKAEINDDRLVLAIACSDNISDLLPFKNQSEPSWLFIGGGKPVKLIRGCNPPKLTQAIKSELQHEILCMQGKARRNLISTVDQVSRRKKAEDDAMRLAQKLREEREETVAVIEAHSEEPTEKVQVDAEHEEEKRRSKIKEAMEEEDSNTRLLTVMKPYALMVIQSFLLETGAVTEIRDTLVGEFKIVQERLVNLTEEGVRRLFNIPREIPDLSEPEELVIGKGTEDEGDTKDEDLSLAAVGEIETETMISSQSATAHKSPTPQPPEKPGVVFQEDAGGKEEEHDTEHEASEAEPSVLEKPVEKVVKMIPVEVPQDLIGDTLVILMDCKEIRKIIEAEEDSEMKTTLYTTADDYIQKRVGPESYEEAIEEAPKSLVALYGQSPYQPGVWCPRGYDDKKYAMINYFPLFVTELLTLAAPPEPKYLVVVFSTEKALDILDNEEFQSHSKDVVAHCRTIITAVLLHQILKSRKLEVDEFKIQKRLLAKEVFIVSFNEKNKLLKEYLLAAQPIHTSVDNYYGKVETAKLFKYLDLLIDEPTESDVLELILSQMKPANGNEKIPEEGANNEIAEEQRGVVVEEGDLTNESPILRNENDLVEMTYESPTKTPEKGTDCEDNVQLEASDAETDEGLIVDTLAGA